MNIGSTIERHARSIPEKIAIYFRSKSYSYDRFNREVNRIAHSLLTEGVKKGDKIALMMKNSDMFMFVYYAIMKVGAVAVPVNFRLTTREITYILNDSDSSIVFFDDEYCETIYQSTQGNEKVKFAISIGVRTAPGQKRLDEVITSIETDPLIQVEEWDDAQILYTSGTTGLPKGVLLDHHRVLHASIRNAMIQKMDSNDRILHIAPLFHAAQLNVFMITSNYLGCTQVVHEAFVPEEVLNAIDKYKITLYFGVPTMYNFLLQVKDRDKYNLTSVTRCTYGAAPMPSELIKKAMKMFETDQFINLCGLTEGGPGGIALLPSEHKDKLGTCGKAQFNDEAQVVNDFGEQIKPGEVGELILRCESVMKEYYKKPEETQKVLRNGWIYTGDLATIDIDGYINLVDRKKDMIISGGENIYSTEVEQILYKHPNILEAAVIGVPDEIWGETVAAVVVAKAGKKLEHNEIIAFCRRELAGYKVPRLIFEYSEIPRNASGKVLKYKLRDEIKTFPLKD